MKAIIIFFALALTACTSGCAPKKEDEQIAALKQQVVQLQSELDQRSQSAFFQSDQSLIAIEDARKQFYSTHYDGMVPESVQSVASSINAAIDEGVPLDKFTAYVHDIGFEDDAVKLSIDKIDRNPDWEPEDKGDVDYFVNNEEKLETISINRDVCLAIDPNNQLTLAMLDENFGKYISYADGEEPAAFDFYTCAENVLFIIEAFKP